MLMQLIPSLVIYQGLAYHTVGHQISSYVGDPLNIVKILSEYQVDEVAVVIKDASSLDVLKSVAKFCQRPLSLSGVGKNYDLIYESLKSGVDRIAINFENFDIEELLTLHNTFGKSTLIGNFNLPDNYKADELLQPSMEIFFDCFSEVIVHDVSRSGTQTGLDPLLIKIVNKLNERGSCKFSIEGGFNGNTENLGTKSSVYYSSKYIFKSKNIEHNNIMINPMVQI